MKITKVDVILLDMKPADNPGWAPIVCRVYTDEGIYGDGEAALAFGRAHRGAFGMIQDFAGAVIGMNPPRQRINLGEALQVNILGAERRPGSILGNLGD